MSSDGEKWKEYANELAPHKYEIGAGILLAFALFYIIWIAYMIYRAYKVRADSSKIVIAPESEYAKSAEFSKYTLTTVGLIFQYLVIASYIIGKIVKTIMVDTGVINVTTCDSTYHFATPVKDAIIYYYIETLFQVLAMLFASCMLTTFNVQLTYLKHAYYNKTSNAKYIWLGIRRVILEILLVLFISIIGVGIPVAIMVLFVLIFYKFVRFVLNCKSGYKLYRYRQQEISDSKGDSEDNTERYEDLQTETVQYGYIATVFCFGAGFYFAQLALDPLASIVEASCTIFPDNRQYIRILFHFINLLMWGSFALVAILFLPFFIPYTLYFIGLICCPAPVLKFLSSASRCFRKPGPKLPNELKEPLIQNETNSNIQNA